MLRSIGKQSDESVQTESVLKIAFIVRLANC